MLRQEPRMGKKDQATLQICHGDEQTTPLFILHTRVQDYISNIILWVMTYRQANSQNNSLYLQTDFVTDSTGLIRSGTRFLSPRGIYNWRYQPRSTPPSCKFQDYNCPPLVPSLIPTLTSHTDRETSGPSRFRELSFYKRPSPLRSRGWSGAG